MKLRLLIFLWVGLWFAAPAHAGIKTSDKAPTQGKSTTVTITDKQNKPIPGARLVVSYYPNSKLKKEEVVQGKSDTGGILKWTPSHPGIVLLTAQVATGTDAKGNTKYKKVASDSVGVKFPGMPPAGLLVFIIAGSLLFGGMFFGFYRAFGSKS